MKTWLLFYLFTIVIISFLSCSEHKYKYTYKVCDKKLYTEVYSANSLGLDASYLTDSSNFRMSVGTFDSEHDYYTYDCIGDSIYIQKVLTGNKNCRWVITEDSIKTVVCDTEIINKSTLSLNSLKKQNKFDN